MARKNIHIVPRGTGWAVKREGSDRASKVTETQREAIQSGRQTAKREGAELVIHGENGQIRAKDSYGNDPYPPKG